MKKIIPVVALLIIILTIYSKNSITIPSNAIRFRVIADSNEEIDQNFKKQLITALLPTIASLNYDNKISPSDVITSKIPEINNIVEQTKITNNYSKDYKINYGKNYFPEKEYKGVKYPAGEYESLVITLGTGIGDNFWCVLFPPLCLIEAEEENISEVKYTSFIQEIINKYFS